MDGIQIIRNARAVAGRPNAPITRAERYAPLATLLAAIAFVAAVLWFAGCAPIPAPQTTPPQPKWSVYIDVWGGPGRKVPGATLLIDVGASWGRLVLTADENGNATAHVPASLVHSHIWVTADGYEPFEAHLPTDTCRTAAGAPCGAALSDGARVSINLTPLPPPIAPVVERWTADGPMLRQGGPYARWKGVTAFPLYRQYLAGADIDPFLHWAHKTGFNLLRVLGAFTLNRSDRSEWLDPRRAPAYWDKVAPFLALAAAHGLRVEWTALADLQCAANRLCVSTEEASGWLDRLAPILASSPAALMEICNEPAFNGCDMGALVAHGRAPGLLVASGNYDIPRLAPSLPALRDYITVHPQRSDDWPRKYKDPAREFGFTGFAWTADDGKTEIGRFAPARVPVIADEPIGAAEYDAGGRRSSVASDFYDFAALVGMYSPGGTYHCEDCMEGRVPTPGSKQQAAAEAFVAALDAVPVDAPLGHYTAGHLSDCPLVHSDATALRTFCSIQGGRATCIVQRKAYDAPTPRDGWRVVSQAGPRGQLVMLER